MRGCEDEEEFNTEHEETKEETTFDERGVIRRSQ